MMEINKFERYWLIAVGLTLGAFTAATVLAVTVFGIRLPVPVERVDPQRLEQSWVFDAGPEAGNPPVLRFPRRSQVTFYVTSQDVMHGFQIENHTINLELVPGQVARATVNFNRPGKYHIICNHYCGAGHHVMYGTIIVE
jgi:heme/copper-type cytochrome/quinol oxidase subunit 2